MATLIETYIDMLRGGVIPRDLNKLTTIQRLWVPNKKFRSKKQKQKYQEA